ncbi:hypothetical protein [Endozoicomonas sp. 4G]|uniref:hypothetical protein n=1 Tax=Endozoicomonas sp. 4G TaxID=2872754 RepID=UPI002078FA72|nr:hypothetical protein [Endozoicomonas sp. 4G]
MRKYQLLLLLLVVVYLGFMSTSYAGRQLNAVDCHYLYTPHGTDWYFAPDSDPTAATGNQCNLYGFYSGYCPHGKRYYCCMGVGGLTKASDTDYFGGVSILSKAGWVLYKVYQTKADVFRGVAGEIREAFEKCMSLE